MCRLKSNQFIGVYFSLFACIAQTVSTLLCFHFSASLYLYSAMYVKTCEVMVVSLPAQFLLSLAGMQCAHTLCLAPCCETFLLRKLCPGGWERHVLMFALAGGEGENSNNNKLVSEVLIFHDLSGYLLLQRRWNLGCACIFTFI